MVHVAEVCAECTQNCLLMHKKDKNPSPVATTFFKVMFGDEYSKVLFLPPRFAHSVRNMVGKATRLEDPSGEKWKVKFTMIDGFLAFEEGWNAFSTAHGLKVGDFLVFHYIMESHFVVLMYGQSGCPEIQHFGFNRHQMEDTRKKQSLITDNTNSKPSNVNTTDHHISCESSQSEHSDNEHPEIRPSVGTQHKDERIKKKGTAVQLPPSVNAKNTCNRLLASSSRPGPSVSGKELVGDENPDNMVSETPPTVKQFCLVDNDIEHVEDEHRSNLINRFHLDRLPTKKRAIENLENLSERLSSRDCLHDLSIPEINPLESDDVRKNNVAVGGCGNATQINKSGKTLETRSEESRENPKKSTIMPSEATCNNSIKKRLRSSNLPIARPKKAKKEPAGASETDTLGSRLHDAVRPSPSTEIFPKSIATKKELISDEKDNDRFVKPEPVDYDEALPPGPTNSLFSAVMSSYQYLELPEWVKLKKVILLRNGGDLWPVLYQNQLGLKALTQSWQVFARERGIQPGDNCEFVLESEPNADLPCSVFRVHVTAK
ncbi:B3 domain-containing protein Os01g0905400-like isoform X2 [Cynara cardunculus var. scolymus]|uniref:B3 domain-containing protein Os01g0905400-like isoform X2 n=1 Tax=Cynara cardunculus var. scolymus TaxID=59895 RepID=UPI000D6259D4|nr:B3 domain-containing protein Os01g0905400-like isoform X2 [Cynara cardunculus var. scolymus]